MASAPMKMPRRWPQRTALACSWLLAGLPLSATPLQEFPPARPADAGAPQLVWDLAPSLRDGLPRNFRTASMPLAAKGAALPDLTGLAGLRCSGSGQFSSAGLQLILAKVSAPVTVFDLRQEDHGFVNGIPVSWYATNNWANVGKSHDTVVADEIARLAAFQSGGSIDVADDSAKKGKKTAAPVEHLVIARAQAEAALVAAAGASYVRVTVSDHSRPTDAEVDRFLLAVRQLPADGWVHFHCRAGVGRTSTFLALYDMLRNASRVSLEDIVNRQALLLTDYNLLSKAADVEWKAGVFADRAAFVRAFYDYARQNPGGRPQLWTEWLKTTGSSG